MARRLFALLFTPLTIAGAQSATSPGDSLHLISLQEAVALAQRNAPSAIQARGQLRTTSSAVRSVYGAFLPSLSYSMGKSTTTGQRFDNLRNEVVTVSNPANYSAGLSSSIDLFDGGRRFTDLRARRADVDAAEANVTSQHFTIALNVKREYANILAARESEAAARAQLEQAQAQLQAAVARVQAGAATMSDSLRSVIQVGNARLALLTAQNSLRVGSASLTRLVGTQFLVTANPADTADLPMTSVDSATLAQWALQGPAVRQSELQARAANAAVFSARTSYMPTVRMSYGYNGSGTNPWNFSDDSTKRFLTNKSLSFNLSFPLFNNFSREDQVVRARVSADNAEAQLRDARLAAQQSLVQQFGALRTAEERIKIQQASVLAAQEDLRVMQQRYALSASTLLDLLTSQSQLNQARAALIQARQDYRIARAQIEAIIGRDLP
jgi:outer membrane protein